MSRSHSHAIDVLPARQESTTLYELPATVVQTHARPDRSDRYVPINTQKIIQLLEKDNYSFHRAQVKVTRSKTADPLYARHQVTLRNALAPAYNGLQPEFIIDNSHDGSSSLQVLLGFFRFVCSNGLIVGTTFGKARIRHSGKEAADVLKQISDLSKNTAPLFEKIDKWSAIQLSKPQSHEFARLASVLRWGDAGRFEVEDVLQVRREGDDRGDLWTTFNRIQENAIRGGLSGMSRSGRAATSRPLSEIGKSTEFNAKLWTLAEDFAEVL